MLGSLFKHGWQSDTVETRLSFIEKMDVSNSENQTIFTEIAHSDTESSVRCAALNKLTDPKSVFQISQTHIDENTRQFAEQVFAKLIGAKSDISVNKLKELISSEPATSALIIKYGKHADLRKELLSQLTEHQQAELIADVEFADTRYIIAQKLNSIETLELARNSLKGKDKNSEKVIREKIDLIHAQEKQAVENAQTALLLCEKMEYIAKQSDWRAEFIGQYSVWSQRWNQMDFTPDKVIQDRYKTAYQVVSKKVELKISVENAELAQQQLVAKLNDHCLKIANNSLEELNQRHDSYVELLENALNDWKLQNNVVEASQKTTKLFTKLQSAIESALTFSTSIVSSDNDINLMQQALTQLAWPDDYPSLTSESEVSIQLKSLSADLAEEQQVATNKLDKLHKRIHRLLGVTKQGNLAQSRRELAAITKVIEKYSGKDRTILNERLEKAKDVVTQMVDWNNFVTEPKYLELCTSMESLVGAKAKPDNLAKKIKALQDQWKEVGYSDASEKHWERFKLAADRAYEPCDKYFKQRQVTRLENLAKREPYLLQMKELFENTNWDDSPDYKAIEASVQKIMRNWQKIKDVEPRSGQKQWKKLTKFKSKLTEKLDVVYDENIELKNQIIAQTSTLLGKDVNEQSLAKLQLFQSRWKQVGITRRKQDQAAWKKFKNVSDKVYVAIQNSRKERRAEEDTQIDGYRQIISHIQRLAKSATDLVDADKQFEEFQAEYQNLPPLPKSLPEKLLKKLNLDYRRAEDSFNKARERILQASRNQIFDVLKRKAALCAQLEHDVVNGIKGDQEQLLNELEKTVIEDKSLSKRFDQRITSALDKDKEQAAEVRKRLCIDLEILLGVESPAEDKALRMSLQLESLKNKGIGQGLSMNETTLKQLSIDWLCLPGAGTEVQNALDARFTGLMKKQKLVRL